MVDPLECVYMGVEGSGMQAGADTGQDEAPRESIPAKMGRQAHEALGAAHAEATMALVKVEEKTNGVIDTVQEKLNGFMDVAYKAKDTVIGGINMAVSTIDTELRQVGPFLKTNARDAVRVVFSQVETIPDLVESIIG